MALDRGSAFQLRRELVTVVTVRLSAIPVLEPVLVPVLY
jgi:hypothetical protein